jgi:hypothetical protein
MFIDEYRLARRGAQLRTVAIVDEEPASQFLYPEFLLFKRLFEQHGIDAFIVAPHELILRDGALCMGREKIDLVYNE